MILGSHKYRYVPLVTSWGPCGTLYALGLGVIACDVVMECIYLKTKRKAIVSSLRCDMCSTKNLSWRFPTELCVGDIEHSVMDVVADAE